jgi:hypothetical protein
MERRLPKKLFVVDSGLAHDTCLPICPIMRLSATSIDSAGKILSHRKSIPAIIPKKTYPLFAKQEQINAYFASLESEKQENK